MKSVFIKSLSVILSVILIFTQIQYVSAKPIELKTFQINEKELFPDQVLLDKAFCQLNALDNFLNENNEITFADLQQENSNLIVNVSENAMLPGLPSDNDATLGIPSFWWGCFLGWVGILLVYMFTDNDKIETKKALNGCLVTGGMVAVVYLVAIVFYGTLATTSYHNY